MTNIFQKKVKKYFENISLSNLYNKIPYESLSMIAFLDEVFHIISSNIPINKSTSFLDFGCGKGYFLKYLSERGYENIQGIDPCEALLSNKLFNNIIYGGFDNNLFNDNLFDIVFSCHTLHHLPQKRPLYAIKEMLRISKKYIVIIEINNTNLPMFFRSLLYLKMEQNAFSYNIWKVNSMLSEIGCSIIYSNNMKSNYLSGNSFGYMILSKMGSPPYNITIAKKNNGIIFA